MSVCMFVWLCVCVHVCMAVCVCGYSSRPVSVSTPLCPPDYAFVFMYPCVSGAFCMRPHSFYLYSSFVSRILIHSDWPKSPHKRPQLASSGILGSDLWCVSLFAGAFFCSPIDAVCFRVPISACAIFCSQQCIPSAPRHWFVK